MMFRTCIRGFTFIEVLVVLAVILIIATISTATFRNLNNSAAHRTATQEVYTSYVDGRNSTLASDGDTVYGVVVEEDRVIRFVGSSYSSTSPSNEVYEFENGVTATGSLVGGGKSLVFKRLSGEPSSTGTVLIVKSDQKATNTLTIHGSGLVTY